MQTIFLSLIFFFSSLMANEPTFILSDAESAYLKEKKEITMCVDPDWEPFEVIDKNGNHVGIAADLIALAAERAGLKIKLIQTKTWQETLLFSKEKKCDILSFVNQTPEREVWLIFTKPILSDPNILITREEHPFIADLHGLDHESVVLPAGTAILERFSKDFPNLRMMSVVSEPDAMQMVSEKKADMTVRSLIVAAYIIKKEGWFNLKISGQPQGYENNLRIGVLKEDTILRDILDKAIALITPIEREAIINKHTGLTIQEGIRYETILKYLAFLLLGVFFFMWRYYVLKQHSAKLLKLSITDKLTGLYNRIKIDDELQKEQKRVLRYKEYASSVMILDIDFFKAVNDTFGHLKGDEILQQVAQLMKNNLRQTDIIGRWGGEEFIIILPNTSVDEAYKVAQKLRITLADTMKPLTISIGLGAFLANETTDSMLGRIDAALYYCKEHGRNQVALA